MSPRSQKRAFGVAAGLPAEVCGPLAETCEETGYSAIFSNDHPGAKGLETLAEFAKVTDSIDLGVGVIALDRQGPETIAADIDRLGLDPSRLWIGVGAGFSKKPLTFMREILPEIREHLAGIRVVMAAMGPKMCALAGGSYDGAFFNWMTADFAAGAKEQVEAGAAEGPAFCAAGIRLRENRDRRRRGKSPGQRGVLLPRSSQGLPRPLRPSRRAGGDGRRRRGRQRRRPGGAGRLLGSRRGRRARPGFSQGRADDRACPRSSTRLS